MAQHSEEIIGKLMLNMSEIEGHKPLHLKKNMSAQISGGVRPIKDDWVKILKLMSETDLPLSCRDVMGLIDLSLSEVRNRISSLRRARLIYPSDDKFPPKYFITNLGLVKLEDLMVERL